MSFGMSRLKPHLWGPLFGLIGLGLISVTPAAAQANACNTGSGVQVVFLGLQQDQNGHQGIILQPTQNGTFDGTFQVHIMCSGPFSTTDVMNAMVDMCSVLVNPVANASLQISGVGFDPTGAQPSVNTPGQTANCSIDTNTGAVSGQPASINVPYGYANVTIATAYPLPPNAVFAQVGRQSVILSQAYGTSLQTSPVGSPLQFSGSPAFSPGVWAQTPELDSLVLFGSGASGIAAYGLLRLRAASKKRENP